MTHRSRGDAGRATPSTSRRRFLGGVAAGAGMVAGVAGGISLPEARAAAALPAGPPAGSFPSGVSSGLVGADSTVLWTQVASPTGADVDIAWEVATDSGFTDIVSGGDGVATAERDHTLKVAVGGLDANSWYYYRFRTDQAYSPIGRTRTAPGADSAPERLRLAFCSCQDFTAGWYTAWRGICNEDIDLVLFLGDYVYEGGGHGFRPNSAGESHTLEDYRRKYRMYKSDLDLQAAHANFPIVPIWDDHEVEDNYDRFVDPARRAAGYQAWFEQMPVFSPGGEDSSQIYRTLRWGSLAEFFLLDLRQYRDPEAPLLQFTLDPRNPMVVQGRSILGDAQKRWFLDAMVATDVTWRVVGNSVMILPWRLLDLDESELRRIVPRLPLNAGLYTNGDSWDGYQHERHEVLSALETGGVRDVVFLTGDVHSFWAGDVRSNFDSPSTQPLGAEFVGGSIASTFIDEFPDLVTWIQGVFRDAFKEVDYIDLENRGYGVLDVTPDTVTCDFRIVDTRAYDATPRTAARFVLDRGGSGMRRVPTA
ncbi:MAG: alkaline phosphatase D family protein [Acidimicrobiia bacterium]|nr:alkaline phosphatase D family protein [Acidimicrobiia bacterium]